jgi:hypothetical protein
MMQKIKSTVWIDLLIILAAGTVTLLFHFQGWKSGEFVNLDMLPYYAGANEFLSTGKIVEKGELSSYNSYNPPGTWFLMIPGEILTSDPRLQELAGTAIVVYGTLIFLYLAARELAGRIVAVPAAAVFALSRLGFMGLWPVGHPLFILASVYFLLLWIKRRAAWALGACVAVLAYGLYVDLAILPFLFVLPALWLIYRPPLGWKSLLTSLVFGLLVWFPYLRYEYSRGFVDLASILLLRPVDTVWKSNPTTPVYCYASRLGENDKPNDMYLPYIGGPEIQQRVIYPESGWKNQAAYASCRFFMNIDRNFDTDLFLAGANRYFNSILWWIFMVAWMTLGWVAARAWRPAQRVIQAIAGRRKWIPLILAAAGALAFYLLAIPALLANFAADKSVPHNISLAILQFREYMPWVWLAVCLGLFFSVFIPDRNPDNVILFVAFSLPWALLVLLGEPGRPERFWYMWPLQVLVTVLFLKWLTERLPRANWITAMLTVALGIALLPLPFYAQRISDARVHGYAGIDSDQWKVVEFLAGEAKTEGGDSLQVEYWLADTQSTVGTSGGERLEDWFNYLLRYPFGVRNSEGGSSGGDAGETWEVVDRNVGSPDALAGLSPIATFGHYSIYRTP